MKRKLAFTTTDTIFSAAFRIPILIVRKIINNRPRHHQVCLEQLRGRNRVCCCVCRSEPDDILGGEWYCMKCFDDYPFSVYSASAS